MEDTMNKTQIMEEIKIEYLSGYTSPMYDADMEEIFKKYRVREKKTNWELFLEIFFPGIYRKLQENKN